MSIILSINMEWGGNCLISQPILGPLSPDACDYLFIQFIGCPTPYLFGQLTLKKGQKTKKKYE